MSGVAEAGPPQVTVPALLDLRIALTPGATALEAGEVELTYAELGVRVDRLARRLAGAGVAPGDLVGVLMRRSVDLVVALLAVAKAGAAYVPLDPRSGYPDADRADRSRLRGAARGRLDARS
ncbi:amino acid adenylation domain-containing protein [Streptacidiphilus sp. 4-A2]|nr:amino acid adenylation domain-containing protein [Streptacidiphilus sp. 4-A2]